MLNRNGKNNSNGSFDWNDAVIDAAILSALTFFTAIGGISIAGGEITQTLVGATLTAGAEFFLFLAIKRGLREAKQ